MARPRLHDDALRTRLLEVASELISAHGESAVTVRRAAADAGTSASAVYALFGSREALVEAVADEGFRRFAEHLTAGGQGADPVADLRELGRAYRRFALAHPHFYRVMFYRGVTPADGEPAGAVDQPTFRVLHAAVGRVLDGAPPQRVLGAAVGLWGLVHGLVSLELAGLLPGDEDARAAAFAQAGGAVAEALLTH
ncbi:TetR/AcrR family transcriptional regulator [Promicromonospora thailandica]|uniref:Transcriptional regulator, TetR family n=1 Tax=Promicromonospora thailandica TaxID=765201 RepID=A0A9X2JX87_9MICO|nr:TetR/AcrR family transcriptional regulator [Promicromonospora thailandica]MCP2263884.1 transcriptional regulator, TetR family [Promicromonospora thailandica]BFF17807.1 TetR/AcrR family transcriptional regulator [Promicromonospora thailandica]